MTIPQVVTSWNKIMEVNQISVEHHLMQMADMVTAAKQPNIDG